MFSVHYSPSCEFKGAVVWVSVDKTSNYKVRRYIERQPHYHSISKREKEEEKEGGFVFFSSSLFFLFHRRTSFLH